MLLKKVFLSSCPLFNYRGKQIERNVSFAPFVYLNIRGTEIKNVYKNHIQIVFISDVNKHVAWLSETT